MSEQQGVRREDLADDGLYREVSPGLYVPADMFRPKPAMTWPQAFAVSVLALSAAACIVGSIWALAVNR